MCNSHPISSILDEHLEMLTRLRTRAEARQSAREEIFEEACALMHDAQGVLPLAQAYPQIPVLASCTPWNRQCSCSSTRWWVSGLKKSTIPESCPQSGTRPVNTWIRWQFHASSLPINLMGTERC